jgi:hypothetical protein
MQITKDSILEVGSTVPIYMAVPENIDTKGGKPFEDYVLKADHDKLVAELKAKIACLENTKPHDLNF